MDSSQSCVSSLPLGLLLRHGCPGGRALGLVFWVFVCVHLTQWSLRTWQGFCCFLFAVESLMAVELVAASAPQAHPMLSAPSQTCVSCLSEFRPVVSVWCAVWIGVCCKAGAEHPSVQLVCLRHAASSCVYGTTVFVWPLGLTRGMMSSSIACFFSWVSAWLLEYFSSNYPKLAWNVKMLVCLLR